MPDDAFRHFAATQLLSRLQKFWIEAEGVRKNLDIEYMHKMRVASRRLRTGVGALAPALPKADLARWMKQLRRITRTLGAARDTDVQILFLERVSAEHPETELQEGLSRLRLRLKQERHLLQKKVVESLDEFADSRVMTELLACLNQMKTGNAAEGESSPMLLHHACEEISKRANRLLALDEFAVQPERVQEHHAMRIAAKHLRYTMETFVPLYGNRLDAAIEDVKELQERLGQMHDCDVWLEQLPRFLSAEEHRTESFFGGAAGEAALVSGVTFLLKDRADERASQYRYFYTEWQKMAEESWWEEIRKVIQAPLAAADIHDGKELI